MPGQKEQHIILNGEVVLASEPIFLYNNRGFCYGDGIFETMHCYGTDIQFIEDHFKRLYEGLELLKLNIPNDSFQLKVEKEVKRLLNRDKIFDGCRIRLTVFRDSDGLFTPSTNSFSYIINYSTLEYPFYSLNSKGLIIDVYKEIPKVVNRFSGIKTANSLLNVMAGIWTKEEALDDCLIINEKNEIIEGFHSNLFLVKSNTLFTPSLTQGCVNGVMRKHIILIAASLGFSVSENKVIDESTILDADEIFLTNAVEGIRWVLGYKQKRYFSKTSRILTDYLNAILFKARK